MKVAICSVPLQSGHKTRGIGIYTKNLLELLEKSDIEIQQFSLISEVKSADVIHFPFFDLFQPTLQVSSGIPTVVTIHDVIPLDFPDYYPPGIKGSFNLIRQRFALRKVAGVITDSQASKVSIVDKLSFPLHKIYPVPLAASQQFKQLPDKDLKKVQNKYNLPEVFALFTGNVNWNKNLLNLTKASLEAGIDIVMVGKSFEERNNLDHPEMKSFKQFLNLYSNHPKVHLLGFVDDKELVEITNSASVLLLPSLAEGFGLPILEAQACGTPVVTSNISSMPEVAGKGALLVDPSSVENIAKSIKLILNDRATREELIKNGLENVRKYSWSRCAQQTIEVYQKMVTK